jgi:hypothetical protein
LLVVAITNRERETQLAFFRFVELTALLAAAGEGAILAGQRGPCRQC